MIVKSLSQCNSIITNDILNWADVVIVEDTVEDCQDGHVDIEEHHREHGTELPVMQDIVASWKNNDSTTGVEQNCQQKDDS